MTCNRISNNDQAWQRMRYHLGAEEGRVSPVAQTEQGSILGNQRPGHKRENGAKFRIVKMRTPSKII